MPSCPSPVHVYVAGVGSVGAALLRQIDARDENGRTLCVVGACTSRRAAWVAPGRGPEALLAGMDEAAPPDWPAIVDRLTQETPRPLVFVDATGSPDVAARYEPLLRAGVHVVTPSKLANTRSQAAFDRLRAAAAENAVLQYMGHLSPEGIEVGVEPVPGDVPFGQLGAQENLFEITTDRYADVPLAVRGPGAGPSVTAAGVLADVLTVAREARPSSSPT